MKQTVRVEEEKLTCKKCGDVLFNKEDVYDSIPDKTDPYLWYIDEELVCDSCGWKTTIRDLIQPAEENHGTTIT